MTRRVCGDCQLCCELMPMPELDKPANARCVHQRDSVGCAIYATRPFACAVWNCRWLGGSEATAALPRPDLAGYVIDIMPDFVTMTDRETGAEQHVQVIQVWCDPSRPDAWRSPEMRAYLHRAAEVDGTAAIIRYGEGAGAIIVFPPPMAADGEWHEITSSRMEEASPERTARLFAGGATLTIETRDEDGRDGREDDRSPEAADHAGEPGSGDRSEPISMQRLRALLQPGGRSEAASDREEALRMSDDFGGAAREELEARLTKVILSMIGSTRAELYAAIVRALQDPPESAFGGDAEKRRRWNAMVEGLTVPIESEIVRTPAARH